MRQLALYKKSIYACFMREHEGGQLDLLVHVPSSVQQYVSSPSFSIEMVTLPWSDLEQKETFAECLERIIDKELGLGDYKRKTASFLGPLTPQRQGDGSADNPFKEAYVAVCEPFDVINISPKYQWISCKDLHLGQEGKANHHDLIGQIALAAYQGWWFGDSYVRH